MAKALCMLAGYLCGSVLAAEIAVRLRADRYARDFGNPGAANVAARFGARWGALVLLGDVGKAALAVFACRSLFPGTPALWAGLGCALGHDFPVFRRFRGGKGVAVTCAAFVFAAPGAGVAACLCGLFAAAASRYLAVGAAVIAAVYPLFTALADGGAERVLLAAAMGALMSARFAPSFWRIARGEERRTMLLRRKK